MRFGIALETFTPPDRKPDPNSLYEMSEEAERLGFDSVWSWDHLLLGSRKVFPLLDSLTTLSMIAARTKKLKVGTSVLIMSLRAPLVLARVLSTIQFMSEGRFILGTAAGWYRREFEGVGVNFERRGRIFEERFKLVRALLNESEVTFSSEEFKLSHTSIEPKGTTPIPMLIGGYAEPVLERAGKLADGWIGYYYPPDAFREAIETVRRAAMQGGRSDSIRGINVVPFAPAATFEEGDKIVREFTAKYMDLPRESTKCSENSGVRGTVAECVKQVEEYERAGVEDLVLIPCFYKLDYVKLAGKEILPRFA